MKTVIRMRDEHGRIVGKVQMEKLPEPIEVLTQFSIAMAILALILGLIL